MFKKIIALLNRKNRGFTLIELIVVIGILAILGALAIPAISGYLDNSKARTNISNAKMILNAASAYLAANPDVSVADLVGKTDPIADPLVAEKYLETIPATADGANFTIDDDTSGKLIVTWTAETDLAAEDPDGDGDAQYPE